MEKLSALERIKRADADRLRPGSVEIGGEKIDVLVKTFPVCEFKDILSGVENKTDDENFQFLAGIFFDPATREPLFAPADFAEMSAPLMGQLMTLFRDVNLGVLINRKN